MSDRDSVFFRNFAIFTVALTLMTIVLVLIGRSLHHKAIGDHSGQVDRSAVLENIQPVARVNTDPDAVSATPPSTSTQAPFGGSADGQVIYDNVCMACHTTGAGGSPKLVKSEWQDRLAQGNDVLYKNAIEGYTGSQGLMPAKGGRSDLTDEQVKAAVDYMVNNLK